MAAKRSTPKWMLATEIVLFGVVTILAIIMVTVFLTGANIVGLYILGVSAIMALPALSLSYLQVFVYERVFENKKQELSWKVVTIVIAWSLIPIVAWIYLIFVSSNLSYILTVFAPFVVVVAFWIIQRASKWTMETLRVYKQVYNK